MADNKQYKVAVYLRLAREDDEVIEMQKDKVLRYAIEQDYGKYSEIPVFADNGASGNDFNRLAFAKMNTAIANGEIDTVIVQSIDRIGRNLIDVGYWLEEMKQKGVNVNAIDGSCDFTTNPVMDYMRDFIAKKRKFSRNLPNANKGGA